MLISKKWLERHVDLADVDILELGERITLNFAELEGIHAVGEPASACVVGYVKSAEHVEGTHLSLCLVDTGDPEPRQIICGAPNIDAGQWVVVALPGMTIGGLTIAERKVRGHLSQGMITSEAELELSDEHDGIFVLSLNGCLDGQTLKAGTRLGDYLDVIDTLFEIDNKSLTHRPDCWGHRGVAREVAALVGRPLKPMNLDVPFTDEAPLRISVDAPTACPRYLAVKMSGLVVEPSPFWLRLALHRVGVRPINNIVDATNFVMLDLGNPLHAFDARDIADHTINVRWAQQGECFKTLDDVEHTLTSSDLLIADTHKGVALAGVMGGLNSEIKDDTSTVILEAANFDAGVIRRTATRLGMRTESSARFEKSLDPELAEQAARSFCVLLKALNSNLQINSTLMDVYSEPAQSPTILLPIERVDRRLGVRLGKARIIAFLTRLQFQVEDAGDHLIVTVPTWRATKDVSIPADLIEEIGRSFGYDNIEPAAPMVQLSQPHGNHRKNFERSARAYLTQGAGLDEILTYSFDVDPFLEKLQWPTESRLYLENPISAEMPAMRTALLPNLLIALQRNERREDTIGIFEIGQVFQPKQGEALPYQPTTLGALIADRQLRTDTEAQLFRRMKGIILGLAHNLGRPNLTLEQGGVNTPCVHPVRQARLMYCGTLLGYIGEIHPRTAQDIELKHGVVVLEIDLDRWRAQTGQDHQYQPLPRFPAVYRDFAVVVDEEIRAEAVRAAIESVSPTLIKAIRFESVYRGAGLPEKTKSMAWSVTIRKDDGTLEDDEIRQLEENIWTALKGAVDGVQRT